MADLGPAVGGILQLVGPLVGPVLKRALGAFIGTTAGMITLGLVALGISWQIAAQGVWWKGLLAGLASLAVFGGLGVFLAMKRAVGSALLRLLGEAQLGAKLTDALFTRLLGVDESLKMGDRGVGAVRTVERVPLAQAEGRLREAVARIGAPEGARGAGAWLRRKIEAALLERVEQLTLARFRDADTREGGVDMVHVRDELAGQVDGVLVDQVEGALARITVLVVVGSAAASMAVAFLVRRYA